MIDRSAIESLLKIQGITANSPEEQIRAVLVEAKYEADEINSVIITLQNTICEDSTHKDGLYKIYRTDKNLKPIEITALLGIDVDVSNWQEGNHRKQGVSTAHFYLILGITILLALGGIMFAMYLNGTGPFYNSIYALK